MKNLIAGGFMFVGGAILIVSRRICGLGPIVGSVIALIGLGMLIYFVFSKDGKYDGK